MTIFDPGSSEKYKRMMATARKVNAERDAVDRENHSPTADDEAALLRDAISAIAAGIETADSACVCEGLDMVQRVELRLRGKKTGAQ